MNQQVETYFWNVPFPCPDCNRSATIIRVALNSRFEILFEGLCAICGVELQATITFDATIIRQLIEMDMSREFETGGENGSTDV